MEPSQFPSYRKTVLLKLAAFGVALCAFAFLTAMLSRGKEPKDLSEGVLPFTFADAGKDLRRELRALHQAGKLPKRREVVFSSDSVALALRLKDLLFDDEFKRVSDSLHAYSVMEAQAKDGETLDIPRLGEISAASSDFEDVFKPWRTRSALMDSLRAISTSQKPVFLGAAFADGDAPPLAELQRALDAEFALRLASADKDGALRAFADSILLGRAVLNSETPDVFIIRDAVARLTSSLRSGLWDRASLKEVQDCLRAARPRPSVQRRLLDYERERALSLFERARCGGFRGADGNAPNLNIIADSVREFKPDGPVTAAKKIWRGMSYDIDADELSHLLLLDRLSGPGFIPYFAVGRIFAAEPVAGRLSGRLRALLSKSLREQSELFAMLDAAEILLRAKAGEAISGEMKSSPFSGAPYRLFSKDGNLVVEYGPEPGAFVAIPES